MRLPAQFSSSFSMISQLLNPIQKAPSGSVTAGESSGANGNPVQHTASSNFSATLNANAEAVGENTYASVNLRMTTTDHGGAVVSTGKLTSTASAVSTGDQTPYTATAADLTVSDADILIKFTRTLSGSGVDEGNNWSTTTTTTSFLAIDIPGITMRTLTVSHEFSGIIDTPPSISGNLSTFDVGVSATGENVSTSLTLASLAVEDQLSSVSLTAGTSVGHDAYLLL